MSKKWEVIKGLDFYNIQDTDTLMSVARDITDKPTAMLLAASDKLYTAAEAADTAFAVLNISDLTPQARGAVREAWPLVQEARAAARPNSAYAEAVKEAHQHEIARLDRIVAELQREVEPAREILQKGFRGTVSTIREAIEIEAYASELNKEEITRRDGIIAKMRLALESAIKTVIFERHPHRPWQDEAREALELVKSISTKPQGGES